ncbi:MAG: helix-turn-helix transcriptional regulator [Rhizobiaceae bacterium]
MTIFAPSPAREILQAPISSRSDFTLALVQLCLDTAADHYMILDISDNAAGKPTQVVASNWVYDTIEIIGLDLVGRLLSGPLVVTSAGQAPKPLALRSYAQLSAILSEEEMLRLAHLGDDELYCLRLNAGRQRYFAVLSAHVAGKMQAEAVMAAQINCCYMLSEMAASSPAPDIPNPLSERERECLFWAAEGKTTDETALILDVSNNTVNGYMQQAIRKLAAPNRAKAIAIAVRNGLL